MNDHEQIMLSRLNREVRALRSTLSTFHQKYPPVPAPAEPTATPAGSIGEIRAATIYEKRNHG